MGRNIPASKRGFGYDPVTRSLGVYVDGALAASFPPTPGRTYFVNNITGASTNDGLSWGTAMDEVSTAITASETYRELGGQEGGRTATTNDYVRNTIMIQGTATAYTGITDLGEHVNLIGLGSPSGGRGGTIWNTTTLKGVARIGSDTASTGGMVSTGDYHGLYIGNIHFQTSGTSPAFEVGGIHESTIEDCGFYYAMTTAGTAPDSMFHIRSGGTGATGLIMERSGCGGNAGVTDRTSYGFMVGDGVDRFSHSRMRDCFWTGWTAAYYLWSTVKYCQGTIIGPHNFFGGFGHGVCNYGILDYNKQTNPTGGLATYVDNYLDALTPMQQYPGFGFAERFIGNHDWTGLIVVSAN